MRNGLAALLLLVTVMAHGAAWHVAPTGDDDAAGSADAPFATIGRGVTACTPGDTVVVHAGHYRETVTINRAGLPEAPITIRTAKDDGPVVVSGADTLTGWSRNEEGLWVTPCAAPVSQLFVDGVMLNEACWPNAPVGDPMARVWAQAQAGTVPGQIVHDELPEADYTGATAHILPGAYWVSWTRAVDQREAGSFAFQADWDQSDPYRVQPGTRFFLFGAKALLDAPGEWWYDGDARMLYLFLEGGMDPNVARVEVKRRDWAFDLRGQAHVHLEGFRVFAASITLEDARNSIVRDCHLRYASHFTDARSWAPRNDTGIVIGGADNRVEHCSVVFSAGNGITLLGENNVVEQCVVRNVNYNATDLAAVWAEGRGNTVRRSTLSHAGRSVFIHRTMKAGRIEYNDMHHAGLMTADLGITYCFNTDGEGTVIAHNWVHDNVSLHTGVGIYIDNDSSNFVIHHNVSWKNNDSGIRLNTTSTNNKVYHNTVLDNGNSLGFWGPDGLDDQPGCEAVNNIFTDKVSLGEGMEAHHNFEGPAPGLVNPEARDFRPAPGSPVIDAGVVLPGINDNFRGDAPDLGAYEAGEARWSAGHDWGEPPVF